jgi:UDP-N-acetylglucosamine 2-epimerase (non-hydrolysing)
LLLVRDRVCQRGAETWNALWPGARAAVSDRSRKLVLVTVHRRESFGDRIKTMFGAIRNLARRHPDWEFVYPVHLNPNVREPAAEILAGLRNVHLIEPLPYEPFVYLMDRASLILTDSGGIQEEAPSLGKPVIVVRETTERQEALLAGTIVLAGNSGRGLELAVERLLKAGKEKAPIRRNPYGDGHAAEKILKVIWKKLGVR